MVKHTTIIRPHSDHIDYSLCSISDQTKYASYSQSEGLHRLEQVISKCIALLGRVSYIWKIFHVILSEIVVVHLANMFNDYILFVFGVVAWMVNC